MSKLWKLIRKIAHKFGVSFAGAHPGTAIKLELCCDGSRAPSPLRTQTTRDRRGGGEANADRRGLIAFVSDAGMCPLRFLTYELSAKITSMPYIQPSYWVEEPMVIKFWDPPPLVVPPRRFCARWLTYHRNDVMEKESEFRRCEWCARRVGARGVTRCTRIFMDLFHRARNPSFT